MDDCIHFRKSQAIARSSLRASLFFSFFFFSLQSSALRQLVQSVDAVGMTVSDMDRSIEFFSKVLEL